MFVNACFFVVTMDLTGNIEYKLDESPKKKISNNKSMESKINCK